MNNYKYKYIVDSSILLKMPRVTSDDTRNISRGFIDPNRPRTTSCQLDHIDFNEHLKKQKVKKR